MEKQQKLSILPGAYVVYRLPPDAPFPHWQGHTQLYAMIRTGDELSIICPQDELPANVSEMGEVEPGWRALKVAGPLDFSLVGILAALTVPLAQAAIPVFALSTYDTDYLLLKEEQLEQAKTVLHEAGWRFQT